MESSIDLVHFRDQTLVIDYLSQIAECLKYHGCISETLAIEFRLKLREFQKNPPLNDESLLIRLRIDRSEFAWGVSFRLGDIPLFINLLRLSLLKPIDLIKSILQQTAHDLMKKAELSFNRPFYLFINQECEVKTLYSSLLLDVAEQMTFAAERLQILKEELNWLLPCHVDTRNQDDEIFEQRLCENLSFQGIRFESLPFQNENRAMREISHQIKNLIIIWKQAFQQIQKNFPSFKLSKNSILYDELYAESLKLENLFINFDADLISLEKHRLAWLLSLQAISQLLEKMRSEINLNLKPAEITEWNGTIPFPASTKRRVVCHFMEKGINPSEAISAVNTLENYCIQRAITPKELVSSELKKVHSLLSEQSLNLLKEMDIDKSLALQLSREKQAVLNRRERLMSFFRSQIGMLLLMTILFSGCGFATPPVSDIDDFVPPIPYHGPPVTPPVQEYKPTKDKIQFNNQKSEENSSDQNTKRSQ